METQYILCFCYFRNVKKERKKITKKCGRESFYFEVYLICISSHSRVAISLSRAETNKLKETFYFIENVFNAERSFMDRRQIVVS